MVTREGAVRLLDFGLAKIDDQFKGLTVVGANLGKLRYMAPEQELNAAQVDHRADIYPLGIMFFEFMTGKTPIPGQKIIDSCPELPRETDAFLARAMARDPNDRFGTVREFREGLLALYKQSQAQQEKAAALAGASRITRWIDAIKTRLAGLFKRKKS